MHGVLVFLAVMALPACSPVPKSAVALPPEQVVFMVMTGGGLVPPVTYALESPSLVVYGDGRVLTMVAGTAPGSVPARYELAQADPLAVATFVTTTASSGLVTATTDFGRPAVTVMPATTVAIHSERGTQAVSVYALTTEFETELTEAQRASRTQLRHLIDAGRQLGGDAPRAAYTPEVVGVYELVSDPADMPPTTLWPGPPTEDFLTPVTQKRWVRCGQLTGEAASTAYRAALSNPGARWLVGTAPRILAVNPLSLARPCT